MPVKSRPTLIAIRLRQLGDVLATLGTLRAIKESDPNRRVVYVVDSLFHELLSEVEFIDLLLPEPPTLTGSGAVRNTNVMYSRFGSCARTA